MATSKKFDRLVEDVLSGRIDRRELMATAGAMGIAGPAALALRASPAGAQDASPTPRSGGTLTAIIVDDPNFLDILVSQLAQVRNIMESVYDTLTYLDASDPTFPIKGRLAKEWSYPEELIMEIKLQEGVTFHNGEDFTADDVKWTIEYVKDPATGSLNAAFLEPIETVEVVDPTTIRFHLNKPWAALPFNLSAIQIYSQSATADSIAEAPNGTGPFMWNEWVPGDHISLTKNPNYWIEGQPYLDEIVFRPIKEKATSLAVMQAGDADVFFTPELKDKETIENDASLRSVPSLMNDSGYILYLNNNRFPMNDQNIRLAAQYALDRETYFQAFLSGLGEKNTSMWTRTHWAYDPINDDAFAYDLDKAREHLAAAGYTDGKNADGDQLSINIVFPKGYPEFKQGSEMFQAAMAELGVDVQVEELELATWIDRIVNTDEYDMSWDYHFQRALDPAYTLSYAFFYPPGPQNIGRYEDPEMTDLIEKGGTTLDQDERKAFYDQFQQRWNEYGYGIIVGEFPLYHAVSQDVEGFYTNPLFFQDFRTVWLNR
ncbi:MAG: ABC transporter substrate-binding protein [Thermomicrobiales bacterium]|nr:ABC transporter substrate-binding protein [Thermomicrobiales bacterium]